MELSDIPVEIQLQIFRYCDGSSLLKLRCCSSNWRNNAAINEIAWAGIQITSHHLLSFTVDDLPPCLSLLSQHTKVLCISDTVEVTTIEGRKNIDANYLKILDHCNALCLRLEFAPNVVYKHLFLLSHLQELRLHGLHSLHEEDLVNICSNLSQLKVLALNNRKAFMELQRDWGVRRRNLSAPMFQHPFSEILKLSMLEELYLVCCPVVNIGEIAVPSLKKLVLIHCEKLSNDTFSHFEALRNLKELTINSRNDVDLSDSALRELLVVPSLDKLCLERCSSVSDETIMSLPPHFNSLKKLDLQDTNISDAVVASIASYLPLLEDLNIGLCSHLTDAALMSVSMIWGLKKLNISCNERRMSALRYTNAGFNTLMNLRGLTVLIAEGLSMHPDTITGEAYAGLCKIPALRELHVGLSTFKNEDLKSFAQITQLEVLGLQGTGQHITDKGLLCLGALTKLRKLNLWRIRRLTENGLDALRSLLPGCDIIWADGARHVWRESTTFGEN